MSFLDDDDSSTLKVGNQHAISCVVSNGEVQRVGRVVNNKKVDYLLTTKFANAADSLVRRTWEDFEWIQERLVQERAGIVVPVLPVKRAASRQAEVDPEFIQVRQEALHRFMQRVVTHEELVDAPSLLPFFTANVSDWTTTKEEARLKDIAAIEATNDSSVNDNTEEESNTVVLSAVEETGPQKKKTLLGQWWSGKRDQMALRSKNLILEEPPAESKRFLDMQSYAEHLDTCIRILAEDSKKLGESQRTTSEHFKTIGAAFAQLWGEHDLSNTSSSTMYQRLGDCWTSIAKHAEHQASFSVGNLEEPLEELILDVTALKEALAKRKKVVYEYTKLVREGRKLQQRFDSMQNMPNMNQMSDVYFALEREIRAHDASVEDRSKFKELITDRLTRDIERFRIQWHERMRQVMERYHKEQAQLFLDKQKLWEGVLPVLADVDAARSAVPTGAKKVAAPAISVSYSTSGATVSFVNTRNEGADKTIDPVSIEPRTFDADLLQLLWDDPVIEPKEGDAWLSTPPSFDPDAIMGESVPNVPRPTSLPPPPPISPTPTEESGPTIPPSPSSPHPVEESYPPMPPPLSSPAQTEESGQTMPPPQSSPPPSEETRPTIPPPPSSPLPTDETSPTIPPLPSRPPPIEESEATLPVSPSSPPPIEESQATVPPSPSSPPPIEESEATRPVSPSSPPPIEESGMTMPVLSSSPSPPTEESEQTLAAPTTVLPSPPSSQPPEAPPSDDSSREAQIVSI